MDTFPRITRKNLEIFKWGIEQKAAEEREKMIMRAVEAVYHPCLESMKRAPDAGSWTVEIDVHPHEKTKYSIQDLYPTILQRLHTLFPDFDITREVYVFTFKLREAAALT
jgi:hypothetical protein